MSHSPQQESKMFQEIEESVACGVVMAFAEMTDSEVKHMILEPLQEFKTEAQPH